VSVVDLVLERFERDEEEGGERVKADSRIQAVLIQAEQRDFQKYRSIWQQL